MRIRKKSTKETSKNSKKKAALIQTTAFSRNFLKMIQIQADQRPKNKATPKAVYPLLQD